MIYSFLLQCKLILQIMYLKKKLFLCLRSKTFERLGLISYRRWRHTGGQLKNTEAVCFVHTCRFKCFFKKKVFWKHCDFLFPVDTCYMWSKPQTLMMLLLMTQTQLSCWQSRDWHELLSLLNVSKIKVYLIVILQYKL